LQQINNQPENCEFNQHGDRQQYAKMITAMAKGIMVVANLGLLREMTQVS
jgi:hypothetical protein